MKTWMMTIEYNSKTSDVILHYAKAIQELSGYPPVEVMNGDAIKTRFHTYDFRKFDHFAAYDKGIVFHTLFRVKVPRVMRALAMCQTFGGAFSCVLVEEERIQRPHQRHHGRIHSLQIDPDAFSHMPKAIDRRRLETQFKDVLQDERIL
ncbi:MAG: hypothetical protein K9K93_06730 [Acholeplasmataceae bacterium]|nr:hypothetical protein [Acholeplasmataceae bacterium]